MQSLSNRQSLIASYILMGIFFAFGYPLASLSKFFLQAFSFMKLLLV